MFAFVENLWLSDSGRQRSLRTELRHREKLQLLNPFDRFLQDATEISAASTKSSSNSMAA